MSQFCGSSRMGRRPVLHESTDAFGIGALADVSISISHRVHAVVHVDVLLMREPYEAREWDDVARAKHRDLSRHPIEVCPRLFSPHPHVKNVADLAGIRELREQYVDWPITNCAADGSNRGWGRQYAVIDVEQPLGGRINAQPGVAAGNRLAEQSQLRPCRVPAVRAQLYDRAEARIPTIGDDFPIQGLLKQHRSASAHVGLDALQVRRAEVVGMLMREPDVRDAFKLF
jgi:hypothetical protein